MVVCLSLASVKSTLVLPFLYRLTRVVPEKGPLNGCVCVCVFVYLYFPVLFCLSVSVKWLAVKTTSEMTYIVSSGALNSTPTSNCGCGFGGGWSCVVDRCCIIQHCSMWDTIDLALSLAWDSLWSLSNHSRYFIMLTIQWVHNKAGVRRELLDTVKARKLAYYGHTMRK